MAESTQQLTDVRRLTADDTEMMTRFLLALPEGDRTFFKEDVDTETVRRWSADARVPRWAVIGENGEPQAMLAIVPGALWSSHVGELRLVVGQDYRRRGLGRRLARVGLTEAVRLGLQKIVVEVAADKEGDIAMFTSIGFEAEALLRDHIRDREGTLRDLVLLSHEVGARSASMDVIGLGGEVGIEDGA
jgi:ribosomal protein S18 acetylase RimI-like enzyme